MSGLIKCANKNDDMLQCKECRGKKEAKEEPEVTIKGCPYLPNQVCSSKCLAYQVPGKGNKIQCLRLWASLRLIDEISIKKDYYGSKLD